MLLDGAREEEKCVATRASDGSCKLLVSLLTCPSFSFFCPSHSASSCRASVAAGRDDTHSQPHLKQNGTNIHAFFDT